MEKFRIIEAECNKSDFKLVNYFMQLDYDLAVIGHAELKKFWERNKERVIKPINEKLDKLILDYKKTIKLYQIKEWKIAYLENRKYYYENNYSRGEETKEYGEIIKKLVELTNNPEYKLILKKIILKSLE